MSLAVRTYRSRAVLLPDEDVRERVGRPRVERPHVDVERIRGLGSGVTRRPGCEIRGEVEQFVELRDVERDRGEVDGDLACVLDEREEVVCDQPELTENRLPPRPKVAHLADVLDALAVG